MIIIDKQGLRADAVRAGGGKWIYIRTLSLSKAYITEETGSTVINCTDGDVPAKCVGFLMSANPANVLALLDELEAKDKQIADYQGLISSLVGVSSSILREVERINKATAAGKGE
ncbi:TPA: ead/Ea22-like family protein [Enterobacter hormaechei subsp. xiangfangensis]|nr:ead/Ea22-like family protein [Enterobacter hormaechei subsp. xiangfangensis]